MLKELIKRFVPAHTYRPVRSLWWRMRRRPIQPGGLVGLRPVSALWGLDRGKPIDFHYIEDFLARHADDIRGRTLETGNTRYTEIFGQGRVTRADVLNLVAGNKDATIVGDLVTGIGIPQDAFDCLIVTNTFQLIYDVRAAVGGCFRALRPGGVLLAHFTALASGVPSSKDWEGDYWRFTSASARRLCEEFFATSDVEVVAYGNVRTATASLYGLAVEDLTPEELRHRDPSFEMVIGVRALKR